MKKKLIIALCFMCMGLLYAREKVTKNGTYIPVLMYEEIQKSKSYFEGIEASKIKGLYTVICVTNDGILSNEKFHDAFKLDDNEIKFSYKKAKGKNYIFDEKTGYSYIKISDSEDYYNAFNSYLKENVLDKSKIVNVILETQGNQILINSKEYLIDKDQWHYTKGINLILYSSDRSTYIGLCEEIGEMFVYSLKNGEGIQKIVDFKIE